MRRGFLLRVLRDLRSYNLSAGGSAKNFYGIAVGQDGIERLDLAVNGRLHIPDYRQAVNHVANRAAGRQRKFRPAIGR